MGCTTNPNPTTIPDTVKGAVIVGFTLEGCAYKPFIKIGDTEDDPDTGKPQILGYSPDNKVPERVLAELFIPQNTFKLVGARLCKCPPYW